MDIEFFNQQGYQLFENILPLNIIEEIRNLLIKDAEVSLDFAKQEINCSDDRNLISYIEKIKQDSVGVSNLTKKTRDALSGHISLETRLNPILRKIPYYPIIQEILKSILKSDVLYMHMPPTARFILPRNIHAGVPPHQDVAYNKHMSDFITMWVPLVEINEECGGVIMYEGSGFISERAVPQKINEFWHQGISTDGYKARHCIMNPGSVLILNQWIIHASKLNNSNHVRYSIDYRFFGETTKSQKHYLDMQTANVFLN